MSCRRFFPGIVFATFVAAAGAFSFCRAAEPASRNRPNILFIMADDHGRQAISCYGSKTIQTPNIDRLAHDGVRFTQVFANNSICSPSRAVLLTGKYNHLCGVRKLEESFDGSQQTFPKLLQKAGYQTAIVGKWHLATQPTGFDYYNVMPCQGRFKDCPLKEIGHPWRDGREGGIVHKGYLTDVITDVSLKWLDHRNPSKPFCMMIHHKAPHGPFIPAPRHKDLFKDTVFPEPPTLLDDYQGRAPEPVKDMLVWSRLVQNNYPQYQYLRKQFTGDRAHDTRLVYQEYMRGYLRLVASLDENVGRVLDYLDETGLSKNTIVIYTSDNGFFQGEHGFYNKMWMYEESLHLPLVVRMPGMKGGTTNSRFVGMFDMAPTILDLAGAKVPEDMQGRSIRPLLLGRPVRWRDDFYYHYYGALGAPEANWIASHEVLGVRSATRKIVYYPKWKNGPFWEFFDLAQDPRELHNLYSDPERQKEVAEYKAKLRELARQYQDPAAEEE